MASDTFGSVSEPLDVSCKEIANPGERFDLNSFKITLEEHLNADRSPRKMRITAYHEAGHAIIASLLGYEISYMTIDPYKCTIGGLGNIVSIGDWSNRPSTFAQMMGFSGCLAQFHTEGGSEDIVGSIVDLEDCPFRNKPERDTPFLALWYFEEEYPELERLFNISKIVNRRIGFRLITLTKDTLDAYKTQLRKLANALLEKKTLSGKEIQNILKIKKRNGAILQEKIYEILEYTIEEVIEECWASRVDSMKSTMEA